MSVKVKIPTQLRQLTGGEKELHVEGVSSLRELIGKIAADNPGLAERILDENGDIRRFINVYVGDEDVRFQQGLDTSVEQGSVISILPAVAGGSAYRLKGSL